MKSRPVLPEIIAPAAAAAVDAAAADIYSRSPNGCSNWQDARDRVLLYLRSLDLPPILGLSVALEVLCRAVKKCEQATEFHPGQAAMLALREVLTEQHLDPQARELWDRDRIACPAEPAVATDAAAEMSRPPVVRASTLPVTPPLARGFMLTELIDRKPVRSFLGRILGRRTASGRPVLKKPPPVSPKGLAGGRRPEAGDEPKAD
ncbi:MAG: hypothetical protein WAM73_19170 [Desulfobacterales bacterium]